MNKLIDSISLKSWGPYNTPILLDQTQTLKVASVAIACFALFHLQLSFSLSVATTMALGCSLIVLVSPSISPSPSDWFSLKHIDTNHLFYALCSRLILVPLYIGFVHGHLGLPIQMVARRILNCDLRIIVLTTLVAPLTEEIFFRGFMQEGLENIAALVSRHLVSLSKKSQEEIGCIGQALFWRCPHSRSTSPRGAIE